MACAGGGAAVPDITFGQVECIFHASLCRTAMHCCVCAECGHTPSGWCSLFCEGPGNNSGPPRTHLPCWALQCVRGGRVNDIAAARNGGHEAARSCEVCWEQTQPLLGKRQGQQVTDCLAVAWITACCMHNVSLFQQLLHHVSCKYQEDILAQCAAPRCLPGTRTTCSTTPVAVAITTESTCVWSSIPPHLQRILSRL